MAPTNLHATPGGEYAPASSLTVDEAVALKNQLSPEEILYELSVQARAAVLDAYGMRAHQTPQGDVIVIVRGTRPAAAQAGNP